MNKVATLGHQTVWTDGDRYDSEPSDDDDEGAGESPPAGESQSIDDSDSILARDLRILIKEKLKEGKNEKEITEDLYSKLLTLAQDKKERKFNYSRKRRRRKR